MRNIRNAIEGKPVGSARQSGTVAWENIKQGTTSEATKALRKKHIRTPVYDESSMQYVGFFRRMGAATLDGFFLSIIQGMLYGFGTIALTSFGAPVDFVYVLVAVAATIQILYLYALPATSLQGTFGKRLVGVKIVNSLGGRITLGQSILRELSKYVSAFLLGVGFLMVLWTEKNQGLHDKIAVTYVVAA